jgi:hypothetical protein
VLAELLDEWQPALLAPVAACVEARRRTGWGVGVCGRGRPTANCASARRLGVTSLSMAPRAVAEVRLALAATGSSTAAASPSWRWAPTTPRASAGRPTDAIAGEGTGQKRRTIMRNTE